jgi:hypothetical protein
MRSITAHIARLAQAIVPATRGNRRRLLAFFTWPPSSKALDVKPGQQQNNIMRSATAHNTHGRRGSKEMKEFFDLLGKAMQSTGTTLRLCLLMLVPATAYVISRLK